MSGEALMILVTARGLVKESATWTQAAMARDAKGEVCDPLDKRATCWCTVGAVRRAVFDLGMRPAGPDTYRAPGEEEALALLEMSIPPEYMTVLNYNDRVGHYSTVALFNKAIELAEAYAQP